MQIIPIFRLPFSMLPGEVSIFHIFEQRYKEMLDFCVSENKPFGVLNNTGNPSTRVGCLARVDQILQEFDDGSSTILCIGTKRFEHLRDIKISPFPRCQMTKFFDDTDKEPDYSCYELRQRASLLIGATDNEFVIPKMTSFELAGLCNLELVEKNKLLQLKSESSRFRLLEQIVDFNIAEEGLSKNKNLYTEFTLEETFH